MPIFGVWRNIKVCNRDFGYQAAIKILLLGKLIIGTLFTIKYFIYNQIKVKSIVTLSADSNS
jgi:hypothetical protein